jgi:putative hydroxymethylpyrimidine transport system substrate-binding protein
VRPTRFIAIAILAGALALALGVAACGSDSDGGPEPLKDATLVLDYLPNGVHAGIYAALADGYYEDEGIDLKVITPTSTADTLRLIESGKADFGLADGIDIATQIDAGRDAKGIMAITQRPSGGLITLKDEGISDPAELDGKTVGVTGVPSDEAVFETIVKDADGDPASSKVVTIGFNGIQALQAGKISAFTGYIPADATAIDAAGQSTRSFAFDKYGGPSYPGLVAFSTQLHIAEEPGLMEGFVRATNRGYDSAIDDPETAVHDLVEAGNGIDRSLALDTFRAYEPLIGPSEGLGHFNAGHLRDLSDFLVRESLIGEPIPPDRFATDEFITADSP